MMSADDDDDDVAAAAPLVGWLTFAFRLAGLGSSKDACASSTSSVPGTPAAEELACAAEAPSFMSSNLRL